MRLRMMATVLMCSLLLAVQPAFPQKAGKGRAAPAGPSLEEPAMVDPRAREVLRQACDFLKAQQQFSYKAEVNDDQVYHGGKRLQHSFDLEAQVQRPDKLRIAGAGDVINKHFYFDGKTITLYDGNHNVYAVRPAPGDIEGALDKAHRELGLTVALSDLASPALYEHVSRDLHHGLYVGVHNVRGVPCHHLAFDRGRVHLQVWIETGEKPLLRKVILTQKLAEGSPQWTATLTDWNLSPQLDAAVFSFVPPKGAEMIDFAPLRATAPQKSKPAVRKKKGGQS